jgi:hypothetical protein
MARRINYGFEKSKKEAKRKQKQAAKLEKKRMKDADKEVLPVDGQVPPTTDADDIPAEESTEKTTD